MSHHVQFMPSVLEDDIIGGTDRFRRKLANMFYKLYTNQRHKLENGSSSPKDTSQANSWFTPPLMPNNGNSPIKHLQKESDQVKVEEASVGGQSSFVQTKTIVTSTAGSDKSKRLALLTTRVTVQDPEDSVGLL